MDIQCLLYVVSSEEKGYHHGNEEFAVRWWAIPKQLPLRNMGSISFASLVRSSVWEESKPPQKMIKRAVGRKDKMELKIKELIRCLPNVAECSWPV